MRKEMHEGGRCPGVRGSWVWGGRGGREGGGAWLGGLRVLLRCKDRDDGDESTGMGPGCGWGGGGDETGHLGPVHVLNPPVAGRGYPMNSDKKTQRYWRAPCTPRTIGKRRGKAVRVNTSFPGETPRRPVEVGAPKRGPGGAKPRAKDRRSDRVVKCEGDGESGGGGPGGRGAWTESGERRMTGVTHGHKLTLYYKVLDTI